MENFVRNSKQNIEKEIERIERQPIACLLYTSDLYGTIHYLISDASNFVTGTVAVIVGGFDAFSI